MIIHGDCLDVLAETLPESIDLIYADPPYCSGRLWTGVVDGQEVSFSDKWVWDLHEHEFKVSDLKGLSHITEPLRRLLGETPLLAYLSFMANRLYECQFVMKPNSSIYVHTDWRVSHYLKIVMDGLFGRENFRNDITWVRDGAGRGAKKTSRQWPREYDSILFYTQGDEYHFDQQYMELSEKQKGLYRYKDQRGWYKTSDIGTYAEETLDKLRQQGRIHTSRNGKEYTKYYLDEAQSTVGSVWTDMYGFVIRTSDKERVGYPTQKPINLLERIILASSRRGDVVLDPFCGSGTTCVAAEMLGREWRGIDQNKQAVQIAEKRIADVKDASPSLPLQW